MPTGRVWGTPLRGSPGREIGLRPGTVAGCLSSTDLKRSRVGTSLKPRTGSPVWGIRLALLTALYYPDLVELGTELRVIAQPGRESGTLLYRRKGSKTVFFERGSPLAAKLKIGSLVTGEVVR